MTLICLRRHLQKLIERHPHVFGTLEVRTARGAGELGTDKAQNKRRDTVAELWRLSQGCRPYEATRWYQAEGSYFEKKGVKEAAKALCDFARDIENEDKPAESAEFVGKLLFEAVRLSRALKVDPEDALARYCTSLVEELKAAKPEK